MKLVKEKGAKLNIDVEMLKRPGQRRLLGRREEALGNPADGDARADAVRARRNRQWSRHRRAAHRLRWRQRAALAGPRVPRHHALSAAARTTSCPTRCTCSPMAVSRRRAARNWRSNSRSRVTPTTPARRLEHERLRVHEDESRDRRSQRGLLKRIGREAAGRRWPFAQEARRADAIGRASARSACRTAASRSGSTPICATH